MSEGFTILHPSCGDRAAAEPATADNGKVCEVIASRHLPGGLSANERSARISVPNALNRRPD